LSTQERATAGSRELSSSWIGLLPAERADLLSRHPLPRAFSCGEADPSADQELPVQHDFHSRSLMQFLCVLILHLLEAEDVKILLQNLGEKLAVEQKRLQTLRPVEGGRSEQPRPASGDRGADEIVVLRCLSPPATRPSRAHLATQADETLGETPSENEQSRPRHNERAQRGGARNSTRSGPIYQARVRLERTKEWIDIAHYWHSVHRKDYEKLVILSEAERVFNDWISRLRGVE
jgi:hypothetical protein